MNKTHFIFSLFVFLCFFGQSGAKEISIEDLKNNINSINHYHAVLVAKSYSPGEIFDPERFIEAKSEVFGEAGKKFKIQSTVNQPQMNAELEVQLIYDGTWLWVQQNVKTSSMKKENKTMASASKIHIASVSPDPINKPFNAYFGISGVGISRDEDLPGTFNKFLNEYDFKPIKETDDEKNTIFIGEKIKSQFSNLPANVPQELKDLMEAQEKYCKLFVSKKNGLIQKYIIGKSPDYPAMSTTITYVSFKKLPENTFKYEVPEGVQVKDITEVVKKQKNMMQSRSSSFSNTGRAAPETGRLRSYNSRAQADLRNATTAQEAYYVDNRTYCKDLNKLLGNNYGLYLNEGVELKILEADKTGYIMEAKHNKGDKTYTMQGPGGQIQDKSKMDSPTGPP